MPKKPSQPLKLNVPFDDTLEGSSQVHPIEAQEAVAVDKVGRRIISFIEALEDARYETDQGTELWYARDLMRLFEYGSWDKFRAVVQRGWVSCRESGIDPAGHFVRVDGKVPWSPDEVFSQPGKNPKGGRPSENVILSRRAAYLIAENADPSKLQVAIAQRYFAEQTRRQEIADQSLEALNEDQRRILIHGEVAEQHKGLSSAAHASGVTTQKDFAIFQTEGYKGMYGGLNVDGIKRVKSIPSRDAILDRMGSAELAANWFRLTQTEERLRRGDIRTSAAANRTHHDIGRKVRQTMIEASGVPPEKLPAADHIKHAQKRVEDAGGDDRSEPKKLETKR